LKDLTRLFLRAAWSKQSPRSSLPLRYLSFVPTTPCTTKPRLTTSPHFTVTVCPVLPLRPSIPFPTDRRFRSTGTPKFSKT
jgi:hypothetical protein